MRNYRDVEAEEALETPGATLRWVIGEKDGAPNFALRVGELEKKADAGKKTPEASPPGAPA